MSPKKILVADDDSGIIDVMKIVLEDDGFEVTTTLNGKNILQLCEQQPDLIFLDISMSGAEGNDICRAIKAKDNCKHIPVILFSAYRNIQQIANDCGADGFLTKPFELSDLLHIAHKHTT